MNLITFLLTIIFSGFVISWLIFIPVVILNIVGIPGALVTGRQHNINFRYILGLLLCVVAHFFVFGIYVYTVSLNIYNNLEFINGYHFLVWLVGLFPIIYPMLKIIGIANRELISSKIEFKHAQTHSLIITLALGVIFYFVLVFIY